MLRGKLAQPPRKDMSAIDDRKNALVLIRELNRLVTCIFVYEYMAAYKTITFE